MFLNAIRWLIMLPSSLIIAFAISMFINFINTFLGGVPEIFIEITSSLFMGASFVIVARMIAPIKNEIVSKSLFFIALAINLFLFLFNIKYDAYMAAFYCLPCIVGAYVGTHLDLTKNI